MCLVQLACHRPSRIECAAIQLVRFIDVFFDQNPISHLAIVGMKAGKAAVLSELSGNMSKHVSRTGPVDPVLACSASMAA